MITVEYASKKLRDERMVAPITIAKIVKVFSYDEGVMHQVLNLWHQGLFSNYHMLPGNGSKEF